MAPSPILKRLFGSCPYGEVDRKIQGEESRKAFAAPDSAKRLAIVWKCMAGSCVVMLACRRSGLQIKGRDLELRGCDSALHHPPITYAAIAFIAKTSKANADPSQVSRLRGSPLL